MWAVIVSKNADDNTAGMRTHYRDIIAPDVRVGL
jgi:hypothetical protein